MDRTDYAVVLVMASNLEEARRLSALLVEKRKAACSNIIPGVHSLFWWQGKMDSAEEVWLLLKTRREMVAEIVKLVRNNHSYEVPEVIALPIVGGNPAYLDWIKDETR